MGFETGTVAFLANLLVGLVFLTAGLTKLRDRARFTGSVRALGILPPGGTRVVAAGLPAVEVALGLGVISGLAPTASLSMAIAMLFSFTLVTLLAFGPGKRFDCACFGPLLGSTDFRGVATRNGALIALSAFALLGTPASWSFSNALLAGVVFLMMLSALMAVKAFQSVGNTNSADFNAGRRNLLTRTTQIAGAAVVMSALGGLLKAAPAEAACQACKTCNPTYLFIACSGGCCAAFWVRDNKNCDGYCYSCSAWRIEEYCNQYDCC